MVLILSNSIDTTTGRVMEQLRFNYDLKCIRINELSINSMPNFRIEINNEKGTSIIVNDYEVNFVWNRKSPEIILPVTKFPELEVFYQNEYNALLSFLDLIQTSKIKNLGSVSYNPYDVNKLYALNIANQIGLKIPSTIVVNNKKDFQVFSKFHSKIITKAIQSVTVTYDKVTKVRRKMFTSAVIPMEEEVAEKFFLSLFQEEIEKEFEIRTFYIYGECYSVAIFSQFNIQTKVDFRNYDRVKPNRLMSYKIPKMLEKQIKLFMDEMNLTTGSIDFIFSKKSEYIFLEVNPFGLFGQFSDLGIDIANVIAKKINEKRKNIN